MNNSLAIVSRSQGCLLGQLAGDALGSLVEFQAPEEICRDYPNGVRLMADGGTWGTIAGQPTDDSEMALVLARALAKHGRYDPSEALKGYVWWLNSHPFDCGSTVSAGLQGCPNLHSQANGALMRVSPLGIFGANYDINQVGEWARQDAALTHPHPICLQANALFTMAISHVIRTGCSPEDLYWQIQSWAQEMNAEPELLRVINDAATEPPRDYVSQQGWVLIAYQNALWQLLQNPNLGDSIVDTIMCGGDTDTNAAICGALLGAVYGRDAVPSQWIERLLNCRPEAGNHNVRHPRPECLWPVDALGLAERLVSPKLNHPQIADPKGKERCFPRQEGR
jgi:ADP-ribosylglycohydrolase